MQEEEENTDKLEKIVSSVLNHVKQKIEDTSMIIFSTHTIVPLLYFIKVMDPELETFKLIYWAQLILFLQGG